MGLKQHWESYKFIASVGSLEDRRIARNFMQYLHRRKIEFRMPFAAETLDDYTDYLFKVMEEHTPSGRYFGTPDDNQMDVFGYFRLPDTRRN